MRTQKNIIPVKDFAIKIFEAKNARVGCLFVNDQADICGLESDSYSKLKSQSEHRKILHHPFHKMISLFPLFYKLIEHINFDDDEEKECTFEKMWCTLNLMHNYENLSLFYSDKSETTTVLNIKSSKDLTDFLFKNFNIQFSDSMTLTEYQFLVETLYKSLYVGDIYSNNTKGVVLSDFISNLSITQKPSNGYQNNKQLQTFFDDITLYTSRILKFKLRYLVVYRSVVNDFFYFIGVNESLSKHIAHFESYFSYMKNLWNEFLKYKEYVSSLSQQQITEEIERHPTIHLYVHNELRFPLESMYCYKIENEQSLYTSEIIKNIEQMIYFYNKLMRNAFFIIQMSSMLEYMKRFNESVMYEIDKRLCLSPVNTQHLYHNIYKPLANYLENIFFLNKELWCFPKQLAIKN